MNSSDTNLGMQMGNIRGFPLVIGGVALFALSLGVSTMIIKGEAYDLSTDAGFYAFIGGAAGALIGAVLFAAGVARGRTSEKLDVTIENG